MKTYLQKSNLIKIGVVAATAISLFGSSLAFATVTPVPATTLTVNAVTGTYGSTTNLSATLSSDEKNVKNRTINFTLNGTSVGSATTASNGVATLNNVSLAGINAGTYNAGVGASFAGDSNYGASSGTAKLTISKATPTLSITNSPVTYNGSPQAVTISAGSVAGTISGVKYDGSATVPTNAKTYAVTASFTPTDSTNYNSLPVGTSAGNFVINKATPTLSVTNSPAVYDGSSHAATVSGSVPGSVNTIKYDGSANAPTDADTYAVTAKFTPTDSTNYNSLPVGTSAGNFVIKPLPVVLSGDRTYDGTATAGHGILSVDNGAWHDDVYVDSGSGTLASKNVGSQPITSFGTLSLGGRDAGNYTLIGASGTVKISDYHITVTAQANTKAYDSNTTAATTPKITSGVLQGSDTANFIETYDNKNVGTGKTLAPSGSVNDGNGGNNYDVDFNASHNGVITKANQTLSFTTPPPTSAAYHSSFTVVAGSTSGLPVSYSVSGVATNVGGVYTMTSGTGTATVRADQVGDADYNPATQLTADVSAGKVAQTITFTPLPNKTIGEPNFSVSATGGASGNAVTFSTASTACTVTLDGSVVHLVSVGSCDITASQAGNDSYSAAPDITQSFNVTAPVDTTAPTADLVFTTPGSSNTGFKVVYSEPVVQVEAENPANYFLHNWPAYGNVDNLTGFVAITYDEGTHTATITFTAPGWYISPEQDWGVRNVHDLAGNVLSPNPTEKTSTPMVPPTAPGIPATTPNPTTNTTQIWNWTAATDPTTVGVDASGISYYEYSITGDTNVGWTNIGNTLSLTTNLPVGTYALHVRAVDNAGNVGAESVGDVIVTSPGADAVLKDLTVNGVIVSGFDPALFAYNVELPIGTTDIPMVAATPNDLNATDTVTQAPGLPGAATVVVTAQNGTTQNTYTINFTVTPPGADATLKDLTVDSATVSGFSPASSTYDVVLPTGTTLIPTVGAMPNDPTATDTVTQATALPGAATVVVTAQNGTTQNTYTINFTVTPAPPAPQAQTSTLNVSLTVDNSAGGTATSSDFTVSVLAAGVSTSTFPGDPVGTAVTINADTSYNVNVSSVANYTMGTNGICNGSGITAGGTVNCKITETYVAPDITPLIASGIIIGGGGGGGGGSAYSIAINGGVPMTATTSVTLSFYGTGAYTMEVSNSSDFSGSAWQPYATTLPWVLGAGSGEKTVYVKYRNVHGDILGTAHASINLTQGQVLGASIGGADAIRIQLIALLQKLLALLQAQLNH